MITLDRLSKTYAGRSGSVEALREISLEIERGEIFGIIGRSGAGKSTLIRCINMLERPSAGRVAIDGVDVTALSGNYSNIIAVRIVDRNQPWLRQLIGIYHSSQIRGYILRHFNGTVYPAF